MKSISDRYDVRCAECGGNIEIVPTSFNYVVIPEYYDRHLRSVITSPKQKKRILKEKKLLDFGGMEFDEAQKEIKSKKKQEPIGSMDEFVKTYKEVIGE